MEYIKENYSNETFLEEFKEVDPNMKSILLSAYVYDLLYAQVIPNVYSYITIKLYFSP